MAQMTDERGAEIVAVQPAVTVDEITRLSDRDLLEYIARNMLTVDKVIDELIIRLPDVLGALDSSPMARTILKLLS